MKRILAAAIFIAVLVGLYFTLMPATKETVLASGGAATPTPQTTAQVQCAATTQTLINGTTIPAIPDFGSITDGDFSLDNLQCAFDSYSWNSFLALNHSPDGAFGDKSGDNETVWETWAESSDIFLTGGADPGAAGATPPREIPDECKALGDTKGLRVISQIGKHPDLLEEATQPFNSGPLIDTNGWYSRFAISVNQPMYDYITENQLYNKAGQAAFSQAGNAVNFTCSCDPDATGSKCSPQGQQGAMMVKAAWKVIAGTDVAADFHATEALVYTPALNDKPASCEIQQMGLVGFHIGHKTINDPQWLWSTFEHVANVPEAGRPQSRASYNYFQPDCEDCNDVNTPPAQPWNPHVQPVAQNMGKSQIERSIPVTDHTVAMNTVVQNELTKGTVWENYHLISTQWPTQATLGTPTTPSAENGWCTSLNPVDPTGAPAPTFLANTTLESYIQGTVPQASSNCISCHKDATMTDGTFSDFTYLLERAKGPTQ
ncbi:hypothetical protein [Ascidiaceihabitans sp.]|uniref:hypothetical protein n=1 Tax=Ascidiaceihabitans sp. TaxID=1872644 RepID=UPI003298B16A